MFSTLRRRIALALVALTAAGIGAFGLAAPAQADIGPKVGLFGPYQIIPDGWQYNTGGGKCLDVRDISQANGARIQMWDCLGWGQWNQWWYFWPVEGVPGQYFITAGHSSKCLDVIDVSYDEYAGIQQWNCLGAQQPNQRWYVGIYDGTRVEIRVTHTWYWLYANWPDNGTYAFQRNWPKLWVLRDRANCYCG